MVLPQTLLATLEEEELEILGDDPLKDFVTDEEIRRLLCCLLNLLKDYPELKSYIK